MQLTLTPDLRPPEPRRVLMIVAQASQEAEEVHVARLPRAVLLYEAMRSTGVFLGFVGLIEVARRQWLPESWSALALVTVLVAVAVLVVDLAVLNPRLVRWTKIQASRDQFLLTTGRFVVTEVAIRVPAILTVDVKQGPVMRMLGLKRIAIRGIGTLPEIPPVSASVANDLQTLLARRVEPQERP